MVLTQNDLVCLVSNPDDKDFPPIEYLKLKENILNKGFFYYSVDNKTINIISSIEDSKTLGVSPFFNNLVMSKKLDLVDNIHGFMTDCCVNSMEFISRFSEAPEVVISAEANNLEPWTSELVVDGYNNDEKHQGLMSNKSVKAIGKDSVYVDGVYILQDWNNVADNIKGNTISFSVKVNRNGIVNIKQMFCFERRAIEDPGDYSIINNLKGKIVFGKRPPKKLAEYSHDVNFKAGYMSFGLKDVKIDSLNYVFDIAEFPTDFRIEEFVVYRLYYSGRLTV